MKIHLTEILKQLGTNASAFAAQLGIARNSLPVNDTYSPTIEKLQLYAERLQIPVWTLIYKECVTVKPSAIYAHRDETARATFERRVREVMAAKHIAKAAAAAQAGMTASSFHLALGRNVSTTVLEKIAIGLGVEPWELFATQREVDEYLGVIPASQPEGYAEPKAEHTQMDLPMGDLFAQMDAAEKIQTVLTDGEYRYGNMVIVCKDGQVTMCGMAS